MARVFSPIDTTYLEMTPVTLIGHTGKHNSLGLVRNKWWSPALFSMEVVQYPVTDIHAYFLFLLQL